MSGTANSTQAAGGDSATGGVTVSSFASSAQRANTSLASGIVTNGLIGAGASTQHPDAGIAIGHIIPLSLSGLTLVPVASETRLIGVAQEIRMLPVNSEQRIFGTS
ncbi:hypothetical protein HDG35_004455 [Paraburkholderia sp. JPY681]|nr:hypothetical protein [Paraburkholderia atlantica]